MASNSPTIVIGQLNDKELQESINKLVTNLDTALETMKQHTKAAVTDMQNTLKSLGDIKVDFGGSADGGSSRRAKSQKTETEAVKQATQARKEYIGTLDQQATAQNRASASASAFLQNEREQLRMRQHEIEANLKTLKSQLTNIEIRPIVRYDATFNRALDGLKQKIQTAQANFYNLPPNSAHAQEALQKLQQLRTEYDNLIKMRKEFETQTQIDKLNTEYDQNTKKLRGLATAMRQASTEEKLLETAMNQGAAAVSKYGDSADKAYQKMAKLSFNRAMSISSADTDLATSKLERLQAILADPRFLGALSPQQIARARKEVGRLEDQLGRTVQQTKTLSSVSEETRKAEQAYVEGGIAREQRRREEIRKTGESAREASKELIKAMSKDPMALDGYNFTKNYDTLRTYLQQIQQMYYQLGKEERESALGQKIQKDIEIVQRALTVLNQYSHEQLKASAEKQPSFGVTNESSIKSLREQLKALTEQYRELTVAEINAGKGDKIIQEFQNINRAAQTLQKTLSRPVSFEAVKKLEERNLDEIAYKIQQLQSFKQGINLKGTNAAQEIKDVDKEIVRLQKDMNKYMSTSREIEKANNALMRSFNYMKNRLAFYFTVGAATAFVKQLIDIRSQYEMNERALGILINSAERGSQIFQELSNMALVSPYTLIELSTAAKQLTAYDIAAKDVVDTTRRLADMASAVGVPIERLTYALGQIKAYGYLNSRDARMFANAGIPLVRELSKYYTELEGKMVSVGDVYDRMKKKAIDFNSVVSVINKMTDEGGKFYDFQAKMAETLKVQLANLTLAWNNMLNDIGASEQGLLTGSIKLLKEVFLHWVDLKEVITNLAISFGLFKATQVLALRTLTSMNTQAAVGVALGTKVQGVLYGIGGALKTVATSYVTWWMAFFSAMVNIYQTATRNAEEIEKLNKGIADGAKESAQEIENFINSAEMAHARLSAQTGKLPKAEAEKTWEALREQIELSASSAKDIIPLLLNIEDINKRLTAAFAFAEKIKDANDKLSDLVDKLDVSQDSVFYGLFGEGMAEDIEDYNEQLRNTAENAAYFEKKNHGFWENFAKAPEILFESVKESLGNSLEEAQKEIVDFSINAANAIKDELGEEGIRDNIQVREAIARVLTEVEKQFPQIKGKGKMLFETIFNRIMANEFRNAVDEQTYYYNLFLERLKKDHGSAFQQVTDEIKKETFKWSSGQIDAIEKTADKVKKDLPLAAQEAIDKILQNLDKQEFKMRIVTEFATTTLDDVQRKFRERFTDKSGYPYKDEKDRERAQAEAEQKYGTFMRKTNESNLEYEERIRKEKQKQLDIKATEQKIINEKSSKEDEASRAIVKNAKESLDAANDFLKAADEVEKWGGYDFTTKKETAADRKAQKQAESELQKALKDEIQLIDKVRSTYKSLYDTGISTDEALAEATEDLEEPIRNINKVLNKYGLKLDISKFVGVTNPHALTQMIQEQIDALMGKAKPAEIQSLKLKVKEYEIDAKKFDQQTFTDSLNKSLNNLKDEYELAVSLDADPELGYAFADAMGINLDTLPRTAQEYADRYTKILNEYLKNKNAGIELPHLNLTDDDLAVYEKMVKEEELNKKVYDEIVKAVNTVRSIRKKEMEEHMKSFDKLIEKYSEYEHKVMNIQNNSASARKELVKRFGNEEQVSEAVRLSTEIGAAKDPEERQRLIEQLSNLAKEVSKENPTAAKINVAITNEEEQGVAKAGFEEFQKSPEWILATGELAGMTRKAIGGLIKSLEQYKKSAKNLDPKQVKQINNALKSLYREQRSKNPFFALSNAIAMAKDKAASYDDAIKKADNDIREFYKNRKDGEELTEKEKEELQKLQDAWQQLKDAQADAGSIDATEVVGSLNTMVSGIKGITGAFTDLFKAISGKDSDLNKVFSILDKAGSTAAMGASIGGGWGAAIGAVIGGITGVISEFGENISGNSGLSRDINASARYVRELELAYVDLEEAINKAYGSNVVGAKRAMAANKELQLAELERQLQLEQERSSKYRDEERIYNLQKQIKELRYEIVNSTREIVDDLLGTDVAGFAENLVSAMITAFKNGEDYMKEFGKSFDTMVDNMIMKSIVARVTGQYIEQIWTDLENKIKSRTAKEADDYAIAQSIQNEYKDLTDAMLLRRYMLTNPDEKNLPAALLSSDEQLEELYLSQQKYRDIVDNMRATVDAAAKNAEDTLNSAQMINNSDINELLNQLAVIKPELGERLKELIGEWYTFGEDSDTQLSALQQGIQGITEDTAGALEGITNGISQQCYLQSDLLTQIRDAVVSMDVDVSLGVMSQILLQLQSSYQIQQSMLLTMENWTNPSGNAVRVELIS